uniref:Tc3 transposase DNA binding domain-containing protein n=1 Tax=Panagrolaimus sp. JU765 TaxID=591449 RepID=A0AC34R0U8_9BILA
MGRAKRLSDYEKSVITGLTDSDVTHVEVDAKIHRFQSVLSYFLLKRVEYGTAKYHGRPKKLSGITGRKINQKSEKPGARCSSIMEEMDLKVTKITVRNILYESKNLRWSEMNVRPRLNEKHKSTQLYADNSK